MRLDEIKRNIRSAVAGLTHSQREGLALDLAEAAAGESVQFVRCNKETLTAWFPQEAGQKEKDRLIGLAMKGGLTEADHDRLVALLADEKEAEKRGDGPLKLTDAERERLRRQGHNPDVVARMDEVHSADDYRRLRAEVEGGGAA